MKSLCLKFHGSSGWSHSVRYPSSVLSIGCPPYHGLSATCSTMVASASYWSWYWSAHSIAIACVWYLQFSLCHTPLMQTLKTHILFLVPVWRQRFLVLVSVLVPSCVVSAVCARPCSSVACSVSFLDCWFCAPPSHGVRDGSRHVASSCCCCAAVVSCRVSVPRVFPLLLRPEREVPSARSVLFHAPLLSTEK